MPLSLEDRDAQGFARVEPLQDNPAPPAPLETAKPVRTVSSEVAAALSSRDYSGSIRYRDIVPITDPYANRAH
jgi:hypothetical protein